MTMKIEAIKIEAVLPIETANLAQSLIHHQGTGSSKESAIRDSLSISRETRSISSCRECKIELAVNALGVSLNGSARDKKHIGYLVFAVPPRHQKHYFRLAIRQPAALGYQRARCHESSLRVVWISPSPICSLSRKALLLKSKNEATIDIRAILLYQAVRPTLFRLASVPSRCRQQEDNAPGGNRSKPQSAHDGYTPNASLLRCAQANGDRVVFTAFAFCLYGLIFSPLSS